MIEGRYQIKPAVPFVPGSEITGRIVETGPGVDASMNGRLALGETDGGGLTAVISLQAQEGGTL
ncbi:MAG: NADPH:quinone oxidoreductase family protein, partial [Actinobacteria bacterium]|nr:NADPH:quinone oxidoreductase family protein [Actinomycetota bacterium]